MGILVRWHSPSTFGHPRRTTRSSRSHGVPSGNGCATIVQHRQSDPRRGRPLPTRHHTLMGGSVVAVLSSNGARPFPPHSHRSLISKAQPRTMPLVSWLANQEVRFLWRRALSSRPKPFVFAPPQGGRSVQKALLVIPRGDGWWLSPSPKSRGRVVASSYPHGCHFTLASGGKGEHIL